VDALQAIVLGIVQGLTEFLPISSTAHLRIVPAFLGWEDPGAAFTAVTQLGTMSAVLLFFRADLWRIARTWALSLRRPELRRQLDARLGWYIGLGTIPIGFFGLVFSDQIESGARDLYLIGTTLIVLGLVLLLAEHVARRDRQIEDITRRDGVLIGLAQACALVPGVSRNGATLAAARARGFGRADANALSRHVALPVIAGAAALKGWRLAKLGLSPGVPAAFAVGTAAAFASTLASARIIRAVERDRSPAPYAAYRVALAAVVIRRLRENRRR
jgi:undecaprenyl-diphosphatase